MRWPHSVARKVINSAAEETVSEALLQDAQRAIDRGFQGSISRSVRPPPPHACWPLSKCRCSFSLGAPLEILDQSHKAYLRRSECLSPSTF